MYDIIIASRGDDTTSFDLVREEHPYAVWLPNMENVWTAMRKAKQMALTEMFWLVTDDLFASTHDGVDFTWKPPEFDRAYPHKWLAREADGNPVEHFHGLYLMPRDYDIDDSEVEAGIPRKVKELDSFGIVANQFDVFFAPSDDRHADERFELLRDRVPGATVLRDAGGIVAAMREAKRITFTSMFWLVTDEFFEADTSCVDMTWKPTVFDRKYPHRFSAKSSNGTTLEGFSGLYLLPKFYDISEYEAETDSLDTVKTIDRFDIVTKPFDMFFISYDERYADRHYGLLKKRFPGIKRVHGIKGIAGAHRRCAELSETSMFWTIDADSVVDESFDFSYRPMHYDKRYLHVWHTRNPVNGLQYGWGAIKLWPRELVMSHDGNYLDYTTSLGRLKVMDEVVATSAFNYDPFRSWRSGFREAVKLARNVGMGDTTDSLARLHAWCTVAKRVPHANDARAGANDGLWYYVNGKEMLSRINDFDWLRDVYLDRANNIRREWDHTGITADDLLGMIGGGDRDA